MTITQSLLLIGISIMSLSSSINVMNEPNNETQLESYQLTQEDILEEQRLGEMELLAQLVQAEAGNQDLTGKRLVVDVVLNRVDSEQFPDTVEDVIFQKKQFSVIEDGAFEKAAWNISEDCFKAVEMEYKERSNNEILYFGTGKSEYADNHFKHQDHWFGY